MGAKGAWCPRSEREAVPGLGEVNRIVITREEADGFQAAPSVPPDPVEPAAPPPRKASGWWKVILSLSVAFPPLLLLLVLAHLLSTRRLAPTDRYDGVATCCRVLLAAGVLWLLLAFLAVAYLTVRVACPPDTVGVFSLKGLPELPWAEAMAAQDVAQDLTDLTVLVVSPSPWQISQRGPMGAGVLVSADETGCLFLTSRHVVESICGKVCMGKVLSVRFPDGQGAVARIVGLHDTLDLALLSAGRAAGGAPFVLPVRPFDEVVTGEAVFVIGHPEGLVFSLSSGLVSQKREGGRVQLSAPISPGNSGGPVFDARGRLLAVVESTMDKTRSPNAENLNFGVRADGLLDRAGWRFHPGLDERRLPNARAKTGASEADEGADPVVGEAE